MEKKDLPLLLLTPLLLAKAPVSVQADQISYSHEVQQSQNAGSTNAVNTLNSTTFNGTQTYDPSGQPFDSDNDSDADPF